MKVLAQRQHRQIAGRLSEYVDGRLGEHDRLRVEEHLCTCAACRADVADLRTTISLLGQAPQVALPRSFVLPLDVAEEQSRYRRLNLAFRALGGATAVTSLAMVALVVGIGVRRAQTDATQSAAPVALYAAKANAEAAPVEAVIEVESEELTGVQDARHRVGAEGSPVARELEAAPQSVEPQAEAASARIASDMVTATSLDSEAGSGPEPEAVAVLPGMAYGGELLDATELPGAKQMAAERSMMSPAPQPVDGFGSGGAGGGIDVSSGAVRGIAPPVKSALPAEAAPLADVAPEVIVTDDLASVELAAETPAESPAEPLAMQVEPTAAQIAPSVPEQAMAPEAVAGSESRSQGTRSAMRRLVLLTLVLGGVLLIMLGALLWVWHRRRSVLA